MFLGRRSAGPRLISVAPYMICSILCYDDLTVASLRMRTLSPRWLDHHPKSVPSQAKGSRSIVSGHAMTHIRLTGTWTRTDPPQQEVIAYVFRRY